MPIVPDDKNWTWVLERDCPECGFHAQDWPRERVGSGTADLGPTWAAVLERGDVAVRRSDDCWSPLEYACHVRDVLKLYRDRLALMLEHEDPLFPNWDQDATAVEDRYGEQDPAAVANELSVAASELGSAFDSVDGDQWARTGRRSDGVAFTVESFARYFIHDPLHHLWDVSGAAHG